MYVAWTVFVLPQNYTIAKDSRGNWIICVYVSHATVYHANIGYICHYYYRQSLSHPSSSHINSNTFELYIKDKMTHPLYRPRWIYKLREIKHRTFLKLLGYYVSLFWYMETLLRAKLTKWNINYNLLFSSYSACFISNWQIKTKYKVFKISGLLC